MNDNIIYPWGDSLPYNSAAERYKHIYGGRLQKVSLSSGFSCPNRDGRLGVGGCTFCNNESFVPSYTARQSIEEQIDSGLTFLKKRYPRTAHFLGYFQAYTNTYANIDHLRALYSRVLSHPEISGIVIGTRPDCASDEVLDLLAELTQRHIIHIEFGVETSNDDILRRVNRGHDFATSVDAISRSKKRGLHTGAHFMFGFGDSREDMLSMAEDINSLPLDTIKLHQLQIIKGTVMAREYAENNLRVHIFDREEYCEFIIDFIERLRPDIAIERFISESPPALSIAPDWGGIRIPQMVDQIINRMRKEGKYQGRLFV